MVLSVDGERVGAVYVEAACRFGSLPQDYARHFVEERGRGHKEINLSNVGELKGSGVISALR